MCLALCRQREYYEGNKHHCRALLEQCLITVNRRISELQDVDTLWKNLKTATISREEKVAVWSEIKLRSVLLSDLHHPGLCETILCAPAGRAHSCAGAQSWPRLEQAFSGKSDGQ